MLIIGAALYLILLFTASHAKIGYFWHITDIHYNPRYSTNGDSRRNCRPPDGGHVGSSSRSPGRFGDYDCDPPWVLVESAVRFMRTRQGDNIEFILWTGDVTSHDVAASPELQWAALSNITALMKTFFSSQFVFPVLGHDDGPQRYSDLFELWRTWLPPEAGNTFAAGGYYSIEMKKEKLRLVLLNTNLYMGAQTEEDPKGQWKWLEATLEKSKKNGETVFLVGHVPPGVDDRMPHGSAHPGSSFDSRFTRKYLRLVRQYHDVITGQFFGHLHADSFRIMFDAEGRRPVSWLMVAPAVTPRRQHGAAINPGLRLYTFNTDNGQIQDYEQFYLDLAAANTQEAPEWQSEYSLRSYYGLPNVSAEAVAALAVSFKDPARQELVQKYSRAVSVRQEGGSCDAACAHRHFCAVTCLEAASYRDCVQTAASSLTSAAPRPRPHWPPPPPLLVAALLPLLLLHAAAASS
ncbi:acid sphingomyelinase-like phosphodiesterase 3a [Schistocerca nitens]|uniref:acid sphingomyelinase-like phosphodiesterase 3a n=1 Tax=Schistocerca nitens TaxID=7011 RepID=UPI002118E42F|nr:acid sphingomyelinase-like phosphodiesterase 3a [Schistocerca nitens]